MQFWSSAGGSIATVARTALSTGLDAILPMRAEKNGIFRRIAGLAIHTKLLKLVKLFDFVLSMPERPSFKKGLEFLAREEAQAAFGIGDGDRLERRDHEVNLIHGNIVTINRVGGMKAVDGTKGINTQEGVRIVVRGEGRENVQLFQGGVTIAAGCKRFWSKS
jgi:hypothetical protein